MQTEWRISHALSHHLYTNSLLDLELALFEPILQWVPHPTKSFAVRYGSWLCSPLLYVILFHSQVFVRADRDWGLGQIDAARDHIEINNASTNCTLHSMKPVSSLVSFTKLEPSWNS